MKYEILTIEEQRSILANQLRSIESDHFIHSNAPRGGGSEEIAAELEERHAAAKAQLAYVDAEIAKQPKKDK